MQSTKRFLVSMLPGVLAVASAIQPALSQELGPRLILEDSVVLEETGGAYIGQPGEMVVAADGSVMIIDVYSGNVVRFDPEGRRIRTYGARGRGPGEFRNVGAAAFVANDMLGVVDGPAPEMEIEFFDYGTGKHLGQVKTIGLVTAAVSQDNRLWLGGVNPDGMNALGYGNLADFGSPNGAVIQGASPIVLDRVRMSRPYVESRTVMTTWSWTRMHVGKDDVLISFGASPFLLRADLEGQVLDTIPLLPATRRGVPADDEFMAMMNLDDVSTREEYEERREEMAKAASLLMNVSRTNDGSIIVVHMDGERKGPMMLGTLYVSSISSDGTRQCADTVVPTSDTDRPIAAFQKDNLFVLDRRMGVGGEAEIQTVVQRFTIDPNSCTGQVETRQ